MNFNLDAESMQQSRHNIFKQNHCLMKISTKSVSNRTCLPSNASTTIEVCVCVCVCLLASFHGKKEASTTCRSCFIRTEEKVHQSSRIPCLVAPYPIFTKQVILQWEIVPYSREWCSETDPSIIQDTRAPCWLLSRFSRTHHTLAHRLPFLWWVTWKSENVVTSMRHCTS
jgi:hypothetical protein